MLIYLIRRFPLYVIGYFVNEICFALPQYVGNVLFLKYLMRALLKKESISKMLLLLAGTAMFLIIADVYEAWFNGKYKFCEEERIHRAFYFQIRNAAQGQELDVYDNPGYYDDMTYVSENIVKDSLALLSYVSKMAAGVINIILIISLFYEIGFGVLLISAGAVILAVLFEIPVVRIQNQRKYAVNSIERKRDYFRKCFFERDSFMELKMTRIGFLLHAKYDESICEQAACEKKYGRKIFLFCFLRELLASNMLMNLVLITYLLYEILIVHALQGSDFIATYNAANVIMGAVTEIIILCGQMAASSFTVRKYRRFITSAGNKEQTDEKCFEKVHSIEFKNVTFSYPGTKRNVLKNISFCVHSGKKIAIVGKNGSGKTTLVHLLMGLYFPTEGEILVNGKTLAREDYSKYRHSFSAFFQGMKPMEATVAENVALDTDVDAGKVCWSLKEANCEDVFEEPQNQIVGVRFDSAGKILSGGESQKLMLAHCFYSEKSILVMDEPSSALDPAAEREFNGKVSELSDDKLIIFVTHRLSTVHMADYIYVIDNGRLVGQGEHDKLLSEEGVYKNMWEIQLKKYGSN